MGDDCLDRVKRLDFLRCTHHNLPCYVKTGTKDGPTKDLSFFICSDQSKACNFFKLIKDFKPTICSKHFKKNELQAIISGDRCSNRRRWFYRCGVGKGESQGWCGKEELQDINLSTEKHSGETVINPDELKPIDLRTQAFNCNKTSREPIITIASDSSEDENVQTMRVQESKSHQRSHLNDVSNHNVMNVNDMLKANKLKPRTILISPQHTNLPSTGLTKPNFSVTHISRITKDTISMLHTSLETRPPSDAQLPDPAGLTVTLLQHQKEALAWLQWRETQKPSGGILADDMGLGKTLTMISLILSMKKASLHDLRHSDTETAFGGTLIVCPASLIHQWKKEIDKRVKPFHLSVNLFHGQGRIKNINQLLRYDIVITSYSTIANEWKICNDSSEKVEKENSWLNKETNNGRKKESSICYVNWSRIVMDEAHVIKNPKSMTSIAVCGLKAHSRWAVTGTPIQNEMGDFYSLVKFLRCTPFDDRKIWKRTVETKTRNSQDRLNMLVKTLLLRRTKNQKINGKPLITLPECNHVTHTFKLCEEEKKVYDILHNISKKMLQMFLHNKQSDSTLTNNMLYSLSTNAESTVLGMKPLQLLRMINLDSKQSNSSSILVMVLRLRQCCSHMSMMYNPLGNENNSSLEEDYDTNVVGMMQNMSIDNRDSVLPNNVCSQHIPNEFKASHTSTKMKTLLDGITTARKADSSVRCVVVSQWTKMLAIVKRHLEFLGLRSESIDGNVTIKKRSEIVDDLNSRTSSIDVLLVSLKAGGVGLNLVGANHLFLIDQHWNPALEAQACDRIYRVGQQKNVWIHRFLCEDTVEEKVVALQNRKRQLADSIVSAEKMSSQKLTFEDLRMMFGV